MLEINADAKSISYKQHTSQAATAQKQQLICNSSSWTLLDMPSLLHTPAYALPAGVCLHVILLQFCCCCHLCMQRLQWLGVSAIDSDGVLLLLTPAHSLQRIAGMSKRGRTG
jgi:hypothetical protein